MNISSVTRLRLRGEDRHADRGEDVEIIRLAGQECLAVVVDRRELHAGRVDRLALRPGVGLLGGALGMLGWVRQREDHGALVDPRHAPRRPSA